MKTTKKKEGEQRSEIQVIKKYLANQDRHLQVGVCDMTILDREQLKRLHNLPLQRDH